MRRNPTIFLVDDDEDDKLLVQECLHEEIPNVTIQSFNNGKHFIEHMLTATTENNMPDLIVLDINMPIMNGIETLYELKKNSMLNITIVMMSTTTSESQRREALSLGAKEFYIKPNSRKELIKIAKRINQTFIQ